MRRPVLVPCLLTVVLTAAGCAGARRTVTATSGTRIEIAVGSCGTGWTNPKAGPQHFVLTNTDTRAGEVLLTDAATGGVYADVEPLGPGTKANLQVDLGGGTYAFRCAMDDEQVVTGPTVTIAGHTKGATPAVLPVTQADLIASTKAYQAYVSAQLPILVRLSIPVRDAIARGDLAGARRAWLPAHLEYERLGAAYGAFGDLDGDINGLPNGLPRGVRDPHWHGLHQLEYGLWHGEAVPALLASANSLLSAERALGVQFAKAQIDPLQIAIRAHEITENALQFELTGETDFGSGSNLATVRANLDGTRTVLTILRPLLSPRYPKLGVLLSRLTRAEHDLDAQRHADGSWTPVESLAVSAREHLDADVSQLTELLAPVATILEPRRSS